ncbi:MAG: acyltransferase [Actinomycetota bacterium]
MTLKDGRFEDDWFSFEVPTGVKIGLRSWVYSSFAFLHSSEAEVTIGNDTGIYSATNFELGPDAEVRIGDFVMIDGACISTNARVEIEDHSMIAFQAVIADSPTAGPGHHPREGRDSNIYIGRNVWIGARSIILGGARLNEGVVVGALAVVDFEVPEFSIVAGNPARIIGTAPPKPRSSDRTKGSP